MNKMLFKLYKKSNSVSLLKMMLVALFVSGCDRVLPQIEAVINTSDTQVEIGKKVTFDATDSNGGAGEIVSYIWKDETDQILSKKATFSYAFTQAGKHNITLVVTNDMSESSQATISINVSDTDENNNTDMEENNDTGTYEGNTTDTDEGSSTDIDTESPTLVLKGDNPVTVKVGSTYIDAGVTATDNIDGNLTDKIKTINNVNTSKVGTYTIVYTVSDQANNESNATRTVEVILAPETPKQAAVKKIKAYVDDPKKSKPTVEDYKNAGVAGVNVDNIDHINIVMAKKQLSDIDTVEKIQKIIDSVNHDLYTTLIGFTEQSSGKEPWITDGTEAGTVMVKDIDKSSSDSLNSSSMIKIDGIYCFTANDGEHGVELWKSDGTEAGTVMVKDIRSGADGSSPYSLTSINGTLYFIADDGEHGVELWKSDGTEAGTVMVKDIQKDVGYEIYIAELTNVNGTLYFLTGNSHRDFNELWKSDGTEKGTVAVKHFSCSHDTYICFLDNFTDVNGTLYFVSKGSDDMPLSPMSAEFSTYSYRELWKSDGTEAGTVMVKEFKSDESDPDISSRNDITGLTDVNGTLYFVARDAINDEGTYHFYGRELWKSDGTEAGTVMVKDVIKDIQSSENNHGAGTRDYITGLTNVNDTIYFTTVNASPYVSTDGNGVSHATHKEQLWKSNGTKEGTVGVTDYLGKNVYIHIDGRLGDKVLYDTYIEQTKTHILYIYDGTDSTPIAP